LEKSECVAALTFENFFFVSQKAQSDPNARAKGGVTPLMLAGLFFFFFFFFFLRARRAVFTLLGVILVVSSKDVSSQ